MVDEITLQSDVEDSVESAFTAILDQSQDCIKLITTDGRLFYMNPNGQRAMQIDAFEAVSFAPWAGLWPVESRALIEDAIDKAGRGEKSRFEAFCPTAAGQPRWWDVSVSPIRDRDGNITHILSTSRDITALHETRESERSRRRDAEREAEVQNLIARESRHRLKNLVSVVAALASLVGRNSPSVPDFLEAFRGHLRRLGAAQDLLGPKGGDTVELSALAEAALDSAGHDDRIHSSVPRGVHVGNQGIQILALVLGELHTNAIKHGALGKDGRVDLSAMTERETVRLRWVETWGRERPAPDMFRRGGTGLDLIRQMTGLYGEPPLLDWSGRGIMVEFSVPLT